MATRETFLIALHRLVQGHTMAALHSLELAQYHRLQDKMRDLFSDLPEGATTNTAGHGEKQKLDATTGRRREADQQFAG